MLDGVDTLFDSSIVRGVRFSELVDAMAGAGVDALADFERDRAVEAGLDPATVNSWEQIHRVYFGPTRFSKQQRLALQAARSARRNLDQLALIERYLKRVGDQTRRWALRRELLQTPGGFDSLRRAAKRLAPPSAKPPRNALTFTRSRAGKRTMVATADEREMADLEHALRRGIDKDRPAAPQMLAAFLRLMRGDGTGSAVAHAVPRPLLLVPLPDYARILRGEGDDTVLALTDATTITGAEFLNRYVANANFDLEAALFHPQEGPVNLYRTQRFANRKQRDLARATMPVCPVPGCRHGADSCEIHHIQAWQHGGETNLDNLSPLCRYHNGTNDDYPPDPRQGGRHRGGPKPSGQGPSGRQPGGRRKRGRRGRIAMVRGAPVWCSPTGFHVPNDGAEFGAMHRLFT